MKNEKKKFIRSVTISIVIVFIVFAFLSFVIVDQIKRINEKNKVDTMKSYVDFQSDIESVFYDNTNLLKGFVAYLQTMDNYDEERVQKYLKALISDNKNIIRNVTIIRDTTIISAYPLEGNESAIGINLAKLEAQKEKVLYVKEKREVVFQGPINLVQGGTGIIARIPVIYNDEYWGQVSIVLDGEKFIQLINDFAHKANLEVAVFLDADYPVKAFNTSDLSLFKRAPIKMDINLNSLSWKLVAVTKSYEEGIPFLLFGLILSFIISMVIGLLIFLNQRSKIMIEKQANTDYLTGLLNRNFLYNYGNMMIERAKRNGDSVVVVMIDLDGFKSINDNYGHKVGDIVLVEFSNRIKKSFRGSEAIFRLGGDEFLIILPDIKDIKCSEMIIQRIIPILESPIDANKNSIQIAASIGISSFPADGNDLLDIMQRADEKMYEEKRNSKKSKVSDS